jgi:bifunctional DNase/RNase
MMRPPLARLLLALSALILSACSFTACSTSPGPAAGDVVGPSGSAGLGNEAAPPDGDLLEAELSTVGWDQLSGSPVVLLRELDSGQVLPIWIGIAEARAISLELHGIELPRPMTHDLMAVLLRNLGAKLEEVVVHDLREGTYFGLLKLRVAGQDEARWIDTRPSDGLALALRTDARIRVAKKLLEERPEFQFRAPDTPEQVVRAAGLTVVALDGVWQREFSLPDDRRGIVVIATSGEARRRGIERGDLIVEINGEVPDQPLDLLDAIADTPVGEKLRVTTWRDGEETSVELDLTTPELPSVENVA